MANLEDAQARAEYGTQCVILNQKVQSLEGSIAWPCASSCFSQEQGLAQGRGQVDPPIIY